MWFLNSNYAGLLDPFQYIMGDEAWFHLSGHINSQNTRYWAVENPQLVHEQPLQNQKIGVRCAMSGMCIIGRIFFDRTVNTEVYMNIFEEFYAQLTEEERQSFFFQQDGATCHTSQVSPRRVWTSSLRNERLAKICGRHILLAYNMRLFSMGTLEKYGIQIKSAHDTGTEEHQQPRSCSHQNHYVTSGIQQHD